MDHQEQDAAYLGIDLGTSGVRAIALDSQGGELGSGQCALRSDFRSGPRHEQDPQEWWTALGTATRAAMATVTDHRLAAVAVDSTSGTILLEGRDLVPRTPGLMYDDSRAVAQADRAAVAGHGVWTKFGVTMQRSWALPRALWLVENTDIEAGSRIVHQGDHMVSRLTGRPTATDSSQALKTGLDLLTMQWPTAVFDQLGLDPSLLPEPVLPGTILGVVSTAAAEHTGIPAGAEVKAGMTDGCAAQIASGALIAGSWSSALGTTLILKGSSVEPLIDPSGAVYGHRSPDGGWLPGGASSIGAGVITEEFAGSDLTELTRQAAGHEHLGWVRYPLTAQGERFPFVAPAARGFSTGVPVDQAEAFAAVLQGIAFTERLAFARLQRLGATIQGQVRLTGGATVNDYWNQLRVDILGRPAVLPASSQAAFGAAILAASEPGTVGSHAASMVRLIRAYEPDIERGAGFGESYEQFTTALTDRGWLPAEIVAAA